MTRNANPKKVIQRVVALALSLWFVARADAAHVPAVGEAAPQWLGHGVDGKKVALDSYKGKVVVISFWATWCPPCRKEMQVLENIQVAGKGLIQVIAINVESNDAFYSAAKALKTLTLKLTSDADQRSFYAYGAKGLPHLVVIGKDERIISVREGYGSEELDDLTAELNAALRAGLPDNAAPAPATGTP